jgi:hypothetical protein
MRHPTTKDRIEQFMMALGREVSSPGRIYFTGGASALLMDWREITLDVDLKADPEPQGFFQALAALKDQMEINLELAAPSDFLPPLPCWEERSIYIARHGKLDFYHYDFYSQALAKIERYHERDRHDVAKMFEQRLVKPLRLRELFDAIGPGLIRYPKIRPEVLARQVYELTSQP